MPARSSPPSTFRRRRPRTHRRRCCVPRPRLLLLVGHGAEQLIADMWRITEAFFAQDETVKGPVRRTVDNPFGYWDRDSRSASGSQRVFDYADPSDRQATSTVGLRDDEFRTTLTEFYDTFSQLATDTLGVIRDALGLGDEHSAEELGFLNERTSSPFVSTTTPSAIRAGRATRGARRTRTDRPRLPHRSGCAHPAPPGRHRRTPGGIHHPRMDRRATLTDAIVVNLGDTMQVWTNDQYKAAVHRVVP